MSCCLGPLQGKVIFTRNEHHFSRLHWLHQRHVLIVSSSWYLGYNGTGPERGPPTIVNGAHTAPPPASWLGRPQTSGRAKRGICSNSATPSSPLTKRTGHHLNSTPASLPTEPHTPYPRTKPPSRIHASAPTSAPTSTPSDHPSHAAIKRQSDICYSRVQSRESRPISFLGRPSLPQAEVGVEKSWALSTAAPWVPGCRATCSTRPQIPIDPGYPP